MAFVLDATDGTRAIMDFFEDLELPVLGQAVGRDDRWVIAIPDTHMVAAHAVQGKLFPPPTHMAGWAVGELCRTAIFIRFELAE